MTLKLYEEELKVLAESEGLERIRDMWDAPEEGWELVNMDESVEAGGKIAGGAIIGKFRGQFFVPDGISQNERSYKDVWQFVLESSRVKDKIANRLMFGTIGHEDKLIDEQDLREGRVSHMITSLKILGKKGMGEAVILDTEAGRNLLTYLKAGAKLRPSSRAYGKFLPNKFHSGKPVVDKNTYLLECFDLVLNPGFKQTGVNLEESKTKKESVMGDEVVKDVIKELQKSRDALQERFNAVAAENDQLKDEKKDLKAQLEASKEEKETSRVKNAEENARDEVEAEARDKKIKETLEKFASLEGLNPTSEDFETLSTCIEGAGFKTIRDFVDSVSKVDLATVSALGEDFDVMEMLEKLAEYEELGEPDFIAETGEMAKEAVDAYAEIGSPDEISEAIDMATDELKAYKELGTVEEIT